jgi:hypothetical protein
METVLSVCLGVGLSAACGFRVFAPLLALSAAAMTGHVALAEPFGWIGTWPALVCFLTALVLEVVAYYVPWLDNLLDSLATPAAVIAGSVLTAAVISDMSPLMKWSLALIAGGGTAGFIQATTVALRGASSATTGGFGNWVIATAELAASIVTAIVSLVAPVLAVCAVALVGFGALIYLRRGNRNREAATPGG